MDVQDLPDYADSNVHGTAVLLAAMARAGVGRLVLASSMVVYGEGLGHCAEHGDVRPGPRRRGRPRGRPVRAAVPGLRRTRWPRRWSARTRRPTRATPTPPASSAQEQLAASWARATGGSVAALRYHNVYGPGLPVDTPYAGVAAIFLSALRRGRAPQVFEDGGQRRDFVHVRDVAAATVAAAERHARRACGRYNVGSGTPRTVGDMAAALAARARRAGAGRSPAPTGSATSGTSPPTRPGCGASWAGRPAVDFARRHAALTRNWRPTQLAPGVSCRSGRRRHRQQHAEPAAAAALATSTVPACASTMPRVIASPSPAPAVVRAVRRAGRLAAEADVEDPGRCVLGDAAALVADDHLGRRPASTR